MHTNNYHVFILYTNYYYKIVLSYAVRR